MNKKNFFFNIFLYFLICHTIIWIVVPLFTNQNLPLDTIEHLAWGSNLDWGFNKHPPLVAFASEIFYRIFGNQDWAFYLLSQVFILSGFVVVWKLSVIFFKNDFYSLISIFLLEGIYFYNFTSPEFNVNITQIPFWALTVYYAWKSITEKSNVNWLLLGFFSAAGFLSKYLFIYLLISITAFFIFNIVKEKKFKKQYFISTFVFLLIISPHLFWLFKNNFITIYYALERTGLEESSILDHFKNPIIFIFKQLIILIPFFIMLRLAITRFNFKLNLKDKKMIYLLFINLLPVFLMFLTSIISGSKIRTMWMTPFYLFLGMMFVYLFQKDINLKKIKKFIYLFLFLFILSPSIYSYISITSNNKRTDYPGKEIADLVQSRWDRNFSNEISVIVGDEWFGGNLSYHLESRPTWYYFLDNRYQEKKKTGGFIFTQKKQLLKESMCPGLYGTIKIQAICMIGSR
jgi:4-amino-4-deoxy-L-arabinose transferase-like glycosyltransferase